MQLLYVDRDTIERYLQKVSNSTEGSDESSASAGDVSSGGVDGSLGWARLGSAGRWGGGQDWGNWGGGVGVCVWC